MKRKRLLALLLACVMLFAQIGITALAAGSYTVTYDANGGSGSMSSDTVNEGDSYTIQANSFSYPGYTITGWKDGNGNSYQPEATISSVSGNVILYAQWTKDASQWVTVDYIGNATGATGDTASDEVVIGSSYTTRANGFSVSGYTFSGWNTKSNGSGTSYAAKGTISNISSDLTLYAQWTANAATTYTVAFNSNGGSGSMTSVTVTAGNSYTVKANTFTYSGYTFAGWKINNSGTTYAAGATIPASAITGNITLYAQWTANSSYTITYNSNYPSGTNSTATQTVTTTTFTAYTLSGAGFTTQSGYTFLGWSTSSAASAASYSAGTSYAASNLTLYAVWYSSNTATITYYPNGGSGSSTTQSGTISASVTLKSSSLYSRSGYTFKEWNTKSGGTGTSYDGGEKITMPSGGLSLYAIWDSDDSDISSFSPSGSSVALSGNIVIKFTSKMKTATIGTITLNGTKITDEGDWSNSDKTYTVAYSDLDAKTKYTVKVSGFKTSGGTTITAETFTFTTGSDDSTATLSIRGVDESNTIIYRDSSTETIGKTITVSAPTVSGYTLNDDSSKKITISSGTNTVTFTYKKSSSSASSGNNQAYISGYSDGTFKPDANLTRAEAAVIFYRLMGSSGTSGSGIEYSDVPAGKWYYDAVTALAAKGIITGYSDGTFKPDATITRAEFTVIALRYAGTSQSTDESTFADVISSHWACGYITAAAKRGYITGYSDNSFKPDGLVTRAEAVTIINRILGRSGRSSGASFTDVTTSHWAYQAITSAATDY